jgi:hypothetical protein
MRKKINELPLSFRINYVRDQPLAVRRQIRNFVELGPGAYSPQSYNGNKS